MSDKPTKFQMTDAHRNFFRECLRDRQDTSVGAAVDTLYALPWNRVVELCSHPSVQDEASVQAFRESVKILEQAGRSLGLSVMLRLDSLTDNWHTTEATTPAVPWSENVAAVLFAINQLLEPQQLRLAAYPLCAGGMYPTKMRLQLLSSAPPKPAPPALPKLTEADRQRLESGRSTDSGLRYVCDNFVAMDDKGANVFVVAFTGPGYPICGFLCRQTPGCVDCSREDVFEVDLQFRSVQTIVPKGTPPNGAFTWQV